MASATAKGARAQPPTSKAEGMIVPQDHRLNMARAKANRSESMV